jgi:hypothetical protein
MRTGSVSQNTHNFIKNYKKPSSIIDNGILINKIFDTFLKSIYRFFEGFIPSLKQWKGELKQWIYHLKI